MVADSCKETQVCEVLHERWQPLAHLLCSVPGPTDCECSAHLGGETRGREGVMYVAVVLLHICKCTIVYIYNYMYC